MPHLEALFVIVLMQAIRQIDDEYLSA